MNRSPTVRRCRLALLVMLGLTPLLLWGTKCSIESMFNIPPFWVPPSNEHRRQFDWFIEHFEGEAVIIVSWPGCHVDDDRLRRFETELARSPDPEHRRRNGRLFDRVLSGYSALRDMMNEPINLRRETALARLRGSLVGPDGQSCCAVIVLTEQGGYDRREAVDVVVETATSICGLSDDQVCLSGSPVDAATIDTAAIDTMKRYVLPSALVSLLTCWICIRSWRYALLILAAAAFGEALVLALVYFTGEPMNAVLVLMPPMVFVVTVAAGVHLVNYYYAEVRSRTATGAAQRAIARGWLPCVLAAATTALGMCSLLVSEVSPIRMFGILSTVGVIVTLVLLLLLLPGGMEMWPATIALDGRKTSRSRNCWESLSAFVIRRWAFVTIAALTTMVLSCVGMTNVQTSVQLKHLFADDSRILRHYAWLEDHIGPMVPVEIVVHFAPNCPLEFMQRMELVRHVASTVEKTDDAAGVISAASFAPPIPKGGSLRQIVRRRIFAARVESQRQRFVDAKYLYEGNDGGQAWRISARVHALQDLDCGLFLERLRDEVGPLVQRSANGRVAGVDATYTGAIPLVYQTQRILLKDLFTSFLTAFATVAGVMMILLRSFWAGLIAMLPNIFPALTVFGIMGWLQVPIDLGSVMTASIALGIAVVDTLHFLTCYRREISDGRSPRRAVRNTYRHCAAAIVQTSIICALGMLVFVLSPFVPASRFAWFVALLLAAAFVGDLILLPALLVGPLGRFFVRRQPAQC